MELTTTSFEPGGPIPARYAFAEHDPESRVRLAGNVNPHLEWTGAPEGAKSFVLICHDPDVPSIGDDVNQPDREVPADLPRVDFFHWVLVDLPVDKSSIAEGEFAEGVVARGQSPEVHVGRHGINDYTGWFAGDAQMAGQYFGYDGPFPPFNDSLVHHYVFTLYAVSGDRLPVEGAFTGAQVREALAGKVLAEATLSGTYTLNRRLARG